MALQKTFSSLKFPRLLLMNSLHTFYHNGCDFQAHHTIPFIISWCLPDTIYLVSAAYISEMLKNEVEITNSYLDKLTINAEHGKKFLNI